MVTVRNKKLYNIGNIIAAIGGIVLIVSGVLDLINFDTNLPIYYFGGLIPGELIDIVRIVFGILILAIYLGKSKIDSPTLKGLLYIVLGALVGDFVSILGGILVILAVYLK